MQLFEPIRMKSDIKFLHFVGVCKLSQPMVQKDGNVNDNWFPIFLVLVKLNRRLYGRTCCKKLSDAVDGTKSDWIREWQSELQSTLLDWNFCTYSEKLHDCSRIEMHSMSTW